MESQQSKTESCTPLNTHFKLLFFFSSLMGATLNARLDGFEALARTDVRKDGRA